jgi:hypothetical protein
MKRKSLAFVTYLIRSTAEETCCPDCGFTLDVGDHAGELVGEDGYSFAAGFDSEACARDWERKHNGGAR